MITLWLERSVACKAVGSALDTDGLLVNYHYLIREIFIWKVLQSKDNWKGLIGTLLVCMVSNFSKLRGFRVKNVVSSHIEPRNTAQIKRAEPARVPHHQKNTIFHCSLEDQRQVNYILNCSLDCFIPTRIRQFPSGSHSKLQASMSFCCCFEEVVWWMIWRHANKSSPKIIMYTPQIDHVRHEVFWARA